MEMRALKGKVIPMKSRPEVLMIFYDFNASRADQNYKKTYNVIIVIMVYLSIKCESFFKK